MPKLSERRIQKSFRALSIIVALSLVVVGCGGTPANQLLRASVAGEVEKVTRLLVETPALAKDMSASSALNRAAMVGHVEVVKLLLNKGVNPNSSTYGMTPLASAILNGNEDVVKILLHAGANIEKIGRGNMGMNALTMAAYQGNSSLVRVIAKAGADPNKYTTGLSFYWRLDRDPEHLRSSFLDSLYTESGKEWASAMLPLHWAAAGGNTDTVRALLDLGAKVSAVDHYGEIAWVDGKFAVKTVRGGRTALHFAAAENHHETVEVLLKRGANVSHRDHDGNTPLDLAKKRGHEKIINLLKSSKKSKPQPEEESNDKMLERGPGPPGSFEWSPRD